jgi:hypothetical protein
MNEAWVELRAVTSELAEADIETRRLFFGLKSNARPAIRSA